MTDRFNELDYLKGWDETHKENKGVVKMKYAEVSKIENKSNEERIFDLECEVSMLTEFINQLTGELKEQGINISNKLND
jgi:predicted nuclease with TOPRIM domain